MQKTILTIVLATFCLFFKANAQNQSTKIKPLKIGDTIPEEVWNMPLQVINHPENKKYITLGEYRNKKLIILDFWATWCSPCVASLDKLAPIYKQNSADLALLPVAAHQGPSISQAEAMMKEKHWSIPSVLDGDQYLFTKVFPPPSGKGIPHMIWIKDNKVIAIPKTAYATAENIKKAINNEQLEIQMDTAEYYPLDYAKRLFVKNNGFTTLYYDNPPYSVIARHVYGYGVGTPTKFIISGDTSILAAVNRRIQDILFDAWGPWIFPNLDATTGISWQISDSLKIRFFNGPKYDKNHLLENDLAFAKWHVGNTYGYNLRYPEKLRKKEALYFMQQDLSRLFGPYLNLHFKIAPAIKHRYAVLKLIKDQISSINALSHKGVKNGMEHKDQRDYFYNQDFRQVFIASIESAITGLTVPSILDSTGIQADLRVDFNFPNKMPKETVLINKELKRYGLALEIKERFVPVLVVTEQKLISSPKP